MIIVELFATDPECNRRYICTGIVDGVMTVTPIVTHAIDNAGSVKRNPDHLRGPNRAANRPK